MYEHVSRTTVTPSTSSAGISEGFGAGACCRDVLDMMGHLLASHMSHLEDEFGDSDGDGADHDRLEDLVVGLGLCGPHIHDPELQVGLQRGNDLKRYLKLERRPKRSRVVVDLFASPPPSE
jgi:hypothetical protein